MKNIYFSPQRPSQDVCLSTKITRQTKRQEKAAPQEIIRIDPEEMCVLRALTDVWASKDALDARLAEGYQKELQLSGPNKNSGTEKSTFQYLSNRAHKKRGRRGKGREWRKEDEEWGKEAEEEEVEEVVKRKRRTEINIIFKSKRYKVRETGSVNIKYGKEEVSTCCCKVSCWFVCWDRILLYNLG